MKTERINNFEKILFEWLYACPYFKELFLIASDTANDTLNGQVTIAPEVLGIDTFIKQHLRGNGIKRYMLNVAQFNTLQTVSNLGAQENVSILDITKSLQVWVQNQIEAENLPEIGYEITEMKTTAVSLAAVDENGGTKAQFQILMDYHYIKGGI